MTNIDQFESVFRSATRDVFRPKKIAIRTVLVVTDLDAYEADRFAGEVQRALGVLASDEPTWRIVRGDEFRTVRDLLALVEEARPDLICTYRHLHSEGWKWPFTLGDHLEVLTQATRTPVLVVAHPATAETARPFTNTREVMALTDHLTGDDALVNYAARLTDPAGTLFLAHVEDATLLARPLDAIAKIPELDTDIARREIPARLLKEAERYIESCRKALAEAGVPLAVEAVVTIGHRLAEYRALIDAHAIDLVVFHTKEDDQLAMHGLAYPLAVELRDIPILML